MISRRAEIYSQALFDLKADEETAKTLKSLCEVFEEKSLLDFFKSAITPVENKKRVLSESFKGLDLEIKNLLYILLDRKGFFLLSEISESYYKLLNEKNLISEGFIYSSQNLSEEQITRVKKQVEIFLNKKLRLKPKQNSSLIAGLYIKTENFIIDDTIENHLSKFKGG